MKVHYAKLKRGRSVAALLTLLAAIFLTPAYGQLDFFGEGAEDPFELGLSPHPGGVMFPTLADIDNDGDLDLFVGEKWNYSSGCFTETSLDFYRNAGNSDCPDFQFEAPYPFGIPEAASNIKFVDINGDGLLDLFGRQDCVSGTSEGSFICILNTGTATDPVFDADGIQYAPFGLDSGDVTAASVATLAFADLDGDGDYDAFINGRTNGHFRYQENIGTPTAPNFKAWQADPFGLSLPALPNGPIFGALADWDCDGDVDMMNTLWHIDIDPDLYQLYFHENKYDELGYISFEPGVPVDIGFIIAQGDLDGDGDLDIMAFQYYARNISSYCVTLPEAAFSFGHTEDGLQYAFTNESTAQSTECDSVQLLWDFGDGIQSREEHPTHVYPESGIYNVCLTVTDIAGNATYCETIQVISGTTQPYRQDGIRLYPNPARDYLYFQLDEAIPGNTARVEVYDAWGRLFKKAELGFAGPAGPARISIAGLPDGWYLVKVANGGQFYVGEFVKE
ncbi:MAG: VCBS repeat-containing protein [Lewinellaceae bacterium]|nr:VCBS repeat-containing protein [Phaeodactylibacter sp.]MCB9040127.1 VCBS repeat-containing protein [Lewinellaceae bacterium]